MRLFHCDRCGSTVAFSDQRCGVCDAALGYVTDQRTLRVLEPMGDTGSYRADGVDATFWRCLNAAWGCNWMLPATSGETWCRSCRLTRGRPDEVRQDAVEAWMAAEAAKRRLVHQLDVLSLPIEFRSDAVPDGLAFDLVHLPGEGGITGHFDGVVTLDLAETDDIHRDDLRRRLGEPFRTVIGHLRHEIGHYFWGCLLDTPDSLERARLLFGDERVDYKRTVEHYYATGGDAWDPVRFVTAYAGSHPFEDWAESFAHYLHILDIVDTAAGHGLVRDGPVTLALTPDAQTGSVVADRVAALDFDQILDVWRPINTAVNAIAESLGTPIVYPFDPTGVVADKLEFVHRRVVGHLDPGPSEPTT